MTALRATAADADTLRAALDVLRRRLEAEGDPEAPPAASLATGRRYEGAVAEAVARFRARHG